MKAYTYLTATSSPNIRATRGFQGSFRGVSRRFGGFPGGFKGLCRLLHVSFSEFSGRLHMRCMTFQDVSRSFQRISEVSGELQGRCRGFRKGFKAFQGVSVDFNGLKGLATGEFQTCFKEFEGFSRE